VTRRLAKGLAIASAVVAGLVVLAAAGVYVRSMLILGRTYDVPLVPIAVPTDSASVAEGARLAATRGCPSCHGARLEGRVVFEARGVARVVAPNLTRAVREHSVAELARVIRHGVRRDGRSVFVMPSAAFAGLSDADLGRLIAFLGTVPPVDGPGYELTVWPRGRVGLATGKFKPVAAGIDHAAVGREAPGAADGATERRALARNPRVLGGYVARTTCAECHGADLRGDPSIGGPGLEVVGGYSLADFTTLLRAGVASGGRELSMMTATARERFVHLTDAEVLGLYLYLRALRP
jgi:mono/diheme cytochrome c family protein